MLKNANTQFLRRNTNLQYHRMNEFSFPKFESLLKGVRSVISISNRDDPVYVSCLYILCLMF